MRNKQNFNFKFLTEEILNNHQFRVIAVRNSLLLFFHVYFNHYVKYPTAEFQKEIISLAEDEAVKTLAIVAFRGSAKSTLISMAYIIWSILGVHQKKHVLILGQTQQQAKLLLKNLKTELESNRLLRIDLGPFEEQEDEWNMSSLSLPKYGARITAASTEQSIRGLRHGPYRPDLIVCDDIEDLASIKTRENRDRIYQWLTGEVIPCGDKNTKLVIIGNLLHEDSLLMKVKRDINEDRLSGVFKEYPLIDENDQCLWPGKYQTPEDIEIEKQRLGNEAAWQREYLLNIVTDYDKVIFSEWIQYYDQLPESAKSCEERFVAMGVDLAISKSDSADFTGIVVGKCYGHGDNFKIFILPNIINKRLTYLETLDNIRQLHDTFKGDLGNPHIYVEEVGYQSAAIEQLKKDGLYVQGVKPHGQDKRARLAMVSHLVQSGKVLFPRQGAEKLIGQITGFGLERHDDLADAFSILLTKCIEQRGYSSCGIIFPRGPRNEWDEDGPETIFGNIWDRKF